jgi:hypothetical protein
MGQSHGRVFRGDRPSGRNQTGGLIRRAPPEELPAAAASLLKSMKVPPRCLDRIFPGPRALCLAKTMTRKTRKTRKTSPFLSVG